MAGRVYHTNRRTGQERHQEEARRLAEEDVGAAAGKGAQGRGSDDTLSEIDELLDEIDSILEENAEAFLAAYCQENGE